MPYSQIALNMEYVSPALSDPDYFYWCVSPIDSDDGKTHVFTSRWSSTWSLENPMSGWKNICEIAHCVADRAEGPYKVVDIALSNKNMPEGQFAPHNVRVKKIDGIYCLIYITQGGPLQKDQKVCLATSKSLYGPWELQGENKDGVVVKSEPTGWTANSLLGCDNPDIIKIKDKYFIYFKSGINFETTRYGYAISDKLESGYVKCETPITDNIAYIEDANAFELNGKIYLLTTDNFGKNTGVQGYGILWVSDDGTSFKLADAEIGFGLMTDYTTIPANYTKPYSEELKFERPAILLREGKPAYFFGSSPINIEGINATENFVLRIRD